jgi:hypothetical protein
VSFTYGLTFEAAGELRDLDGNLLDEDGNLIEAQAITDTPPKEIVDDGRALSSEPG